jgi:NADPH-dependent curcumin reductase CurA
VSQIAKIKGCRVVGLAGTNDKGAWIQDDLGFDAASNYRADDVPNALAAAGPDGIDVYFDNGGGEIRDAYLQLMNVKGRIPTCGLMSQYNATEPVPGPYNYAMIVMQRLRVEGVIVLDVAARYPEALAALGQWMAAGKIKVRPEIVDGLEHALQTVKTLYTGANTGKLMIRVKDV